MDLWSPKDLRTMVREILMAHFPAAANAEDMPSFMTRLYHEPWQVDPQKSEQGPSGVDNSKEVSPDGEVATVALRKTLPACDAPGEEEEQKVGQEIVPSIAEFQLESR